MDKDLESIKAGEGIPKASANNQSTSGTRVEQRGLTSGKKGLRIDQYSLNNEEKNNR